MKRHSNHNFPIHSMQNAISFAFINSVIGDDLSGTILVTVKDGPPKLYHSLVELPTEIVERFGTLMRDQCELEPCRSGVAYFKMHSNCTAFTTQDNDWREQVFETFSQVTRVYRNAAYGVISSIGSHFIPTRQEYDGDESGYIENPWIERKPIVLPRGRYITKKVNEKMFGAFKKPDGRLENRDNLNLMIHCGGGCEDSIKRDIWLCLLNIRSADMTDDEFKEHCAYLKENYGKITINARLSEETIHRIGTCIV